MNKKTLIGAVSAILLILLILDTKTAVSGAKNGIQMCLSSVIPSLFPFIILSSTITSSFIGENIGILRPLGRICGVPAGSESLMLIGLIGGYPVGAQCVYRAYENGEISQRDAQRLLGFCNNAGPAFIFGIVSTLFDSVYYAWITWGIQIISAITIGAMLPGKSNDICHRTTLSNQSFTENIEKSVKVMGAICGWIIFTKIIISYLEKWLRTLLPNEIMVLFCGLIELSNGCIDLHKVCSPLLRFIFANTFLAFGGLCVWLQTISVTGNINRSFFFSGKLLQTVLTFTFSAIISYFLFPSKSIGWSMLIFIVIISICLSVLILKITVALQKKVLYNVKKTSRKECPYALS